jgi:hypothetical protein
MGGKKQNCRALNGRQEAVCEKSARSEKSARKV